MYGCHAVEQKARLLAGAPFRVADRPPAPAAAATFFKCSTRTTDASMEDQLLVEASNAMAIAQTKPAPPTGHGPRHRFWWDGVIPEALGLCFVVIIFVGFGAGYVIANCSWQQQNLDAHRAELHAFAQAWANILGAFAEADDTALRTLELGLSGMPRVQCVRWTTPEGQARYEWSASVRAPGDAATVWASKSRALLVARIPVQSPDGRAAGTLYVERDAHVAAGHDTFLLLNWGFAAGVSLVAFAVFYHRLRRHLRPVAAIERNLQTYADGVERQLLTLTLSDSLGTAARGWNRLIEELAGLQRQVQGAAGAGAANEVLARFENAVFRRVVDRLPFGVICVGEDQRIGYANAAAGGLLGPKSDPLVGRQVGEAIDNPAVVQALIGARARSGGSQSIEHTCGSGEHETTLRFRILGLPSPPAGGDALITVEDVSQLREGQRARDNFLYHVTHELRTPLTNIHAYAETLTQPEFDDEQTRKECYNVLISETRRLSRLVEDILSISQLEVGTARLDVGEVDLARLVRQMVQDNLGTADEKRIDLTLALPPKVPKLNGDKQRLSVLLNNLIGNAIKYTPGNGKVHVAVEVQERQVRIAVQDTGIGIAPEDQAHVFEKFYRATDDAVQAVPGTGLGLALAREVARLHGGDIVLESERGKGSTFTIELPLATTDTAEVSTR